MKNNTLLEIVQTLAVILFAGRTASAQNTGYMNPTDTAAPSGWTKPLNGMVSDTLWSRVAHGAGCNCPWIYLSWDGGTNYTPNELAGPFGNTDSWELASADTSRWGHSWVDSELNNSNFRLKIENPGLSVSQGYRNFNFSIPSGATINGIEVNVQGHGDTGFTYFFLNALEVNVFYTVSTGIGSTTSSSNGIQLYPNPAHNNITLQTSGLRNVNYTLLSIDGRTIAEKNIGNVGTDLSTNINLDGISLGIYIMRISTDEGAEYRKVIIE